jgi:alpha-L-rhamnosidase
MPRISVLGLTQYVTPARDCCNHARYPLIQGDSVSRDDQWQFLLESKAVTEIAPSSAGHVRKKVERTRVVDLKVDNIDLPLGLENPRPQLSWRLESDQRNVRQSAYRILVASSEEILTRGRGDLWDSGKIESSKSFGIEYQGSVLISRQRCWWTVLVWDARSEPCAPSEPSWWEMGLLHPSDWTAQWLAVEDSVAKADREAGLNWIWGELSSDEISRKFRFLLNLPVASSAGELFAVVNDWYWWMQITRIWVDGKPIAGPGTWIAFREAPDGFRNHLSLSKQRLALEPMRAGTHVIAVEVGTRPVAPVIPVDYLPGTTAPAEASYVPAFAALIRLTLANGETLRLGSETQWKTSLSQDSAWHAQDYDDKAWSPAQPAPIKGYQPWPAQPAMHLRRGFAIEKELAHARLYATALGAYEARLNGRRVGNALLTPEPSQYAKRVLYRVYDVTSMLESGGNVLGMTVGDGWYASSEGRFAFAPPPRRALAQLELVFVDGSRQVIGTGPGWRAAQSPLQYSEIKIGEIYDARLEQPGWDSAGFDDVHWETAEIAGTPSCRLVAQITPPIRALQVLRPSTISQPNPGIYVVDFGLQFTGGYRLRVKGARGSRVELRFAEVLAPSGEVEQYNMHDPTGEPRRDVLILQGDPAGESFASCFCYRGFRYVQISGLETAPTAQSIEGVFIHSDVAVTGRIRSSAALIENIWQNILQTQKSNLTGILTDNAMRELRGWMGDAGVFWDTAAFNMDVCTLTSRQMDNAVDGQADDGAFPMVAPPPTHASAWLHARGAPPAWSDGSVILPWTAWRHYGDLGIVERNWEAMNRYLQFIHNHNPDFIWRNLRSHDYGDHLALEATPKDLISTAYWARSTDLLAQMAGAAGRMEDATRLRALFERVRRAFNEAFVKADGTIGTGSQTSYILALQFGLLPEDIKELAAKWLAADVSRRGPALTTGILGTQFILEVLASAGYGSLAYDLLLKTEYPSWGYMVSNGATSIWESWGANNEYSRNQPALGAIGGFLFRRVAGIDAGTPGFETIVIRPLPDSRVPSAGGEYDSVMGRITTDWAQTNEGRFTLEVTIPANATAHIHLPAQRDSRIEEGGEDIAWRDDLHVIHRSDVEAVIAVGSGTYRFISVP